MPTLILASASPQRKRLLSGLCLDFQAIPSFIDEQKCTETDPVKRSILLARLKAEDIADSHLGAFVIGCDTLVVAADGTLMEKPLNEQEARHMLKRHSGRTCTVHSGLCVINPHQQSFVDISSSKVTFKSLTKDDENWWISTGLWRDRSGGFQIDVPGQLMIERMEGDFTGIVGLPVFLLGQLMRKAGYPLTQLH